MSAAETLYDEGAERAVLGAVLVRNEALDEVLEMLEPEHFRRAAHAGLYRAMREIHGKGQPVDPVTIAAALPALGVSDVSPAFVMRLTEGVPRSTNIAAYAATVREKWLKRSLLAEAHQLVKDAEADITSGDALLEQAEAAIYRLGATAIKSDWISSAELASELFEAMERIQNHAGQITGLSTGFADLDEMTGGLHKGDLVLLGARPSLGKTALALQVACHVAKSAPVAFVSVEMSRGPLGMRAVAGEARVDGWRMKQGFVSEVETRRIGEAISTIAEMALYIDESPMVNPLHVRSKLRRLRSRTGTLGLVVIDYLQLMAPLPEHRRENKTNQVAGISRALKIMAREFDVPFLVLAQLNRGLERSADKVPTMADLRDSGALEQDADIVLLLHRPEVFDKQNAALEGVAQLIVGKHRNGATGIVDLQWRKDITRFEGARRA